MAEKRQRQSKNELDKMEQYDQKSNTRWVSELHKLLTPMRTERGAKHKMATEYRRELMQFQIEYETEQLNRELEKVGKASYFSHDYI